MSKSAEVKCPKCGSNLTVSWWTENHKVHNGIGMQTAARDHYREISSRECDCELSREEEEELFDKAAEKISKRRTGYNPPPDEVF